MTPCRSLKIALRDDLALHAREWGDGPFACILIHGFGDGGHIWHEFAPSLASLYRTVAVDLRGHGESGWDAAGRYQVEEHVADVLQMIDALGIVRFVLIGHSAGAEVAIRISALRRANVVAAVLVDFGPTPNRQGMAQASANFTASLRSYGSVSEYAECLQLQRPLVAPAVLRQLAADALRPQANGRYRLKCDPAVANVGEGGPDSAALWNMLKSIACPVLVIRGAASAVLSGETAEQMTRTLRDGSLHVVRTAGHAVMVDSPEEFAQAIHPFLRKCCREWASLPAPNQQRSADCGRVN